MQIKDLRTFLDEYQRAHPDLVARITKEVDAHWEASAIAIEAQKRLPEPPVLIFDRLRKVDGKLSDQPVVLNLFASRSRSAFAVGSTFERVARDTYARRNERIKPIVVDRRQAAVKQVMQKGEAVDLAQLPGLVHAGWDPGPYLSAGYLTTYEPDSGIDNSAMQRGWIYSQREIRIFPSNASHNAWNIKKVEDRGGDARVAYWVGHHPAACIGAEGKLGYPESHWAAAGGLLGQPLRLVASETLGDDFLVPADAEYVIEGIVPRGKLKPEGPFGEFPRYFGGQRLNPYMEVTCVSRREDAHWVAIVTGYADDGIGALRREGLLFDLLSRTVPQVTNIYRPPSCPFYIYVQLHKTQDWQPRAIITTVLSAPEAIKYVYVFDDDIDIFDEQEVHWAVGTRSDWMKDLIVLPDMQVSNLDPTSVRAGIGSRGGIDCTKPASPGVYEQRSFIPEEVTRRIRLSDYLPNVPAGCGDVPARAPARNSPARVDRSSGSHHVPGAHKVAFVLCPACSGEYYVERSTYAGRPEAECHCPFCGHEFPVSEGQPFPPFES
jgi:2,5-furandicarboxylate decarboxylase 1